MLCSRFLWPALVAVAAAAAGCVRPLAQAPPSRVRQPAHVGRGKTQLPAAAQEPEQPPMPSDQPDDLAALALYSRMSELFPKSDYQALALWRFGQVGKRLAVVATRDARAVYGDLPVQSDDMYTEWTGLRRYQRWRLTFEFSHLGQAYYYGGDAFREIVAQHPDSEWADNAAYELIRLSQADGEWEGHPDGPLAYLRKWQDFVRRYPRSDMRPAALLDMVYVNRVLYEIYSDGQFADPAKARMYRQAAERICGNVNREFAGSEYAARAERNLAELAIGHNIYHISASRQ
jgi:hypothetical protein